MGSVVLLTGATGKFGKQLTKDLVEEGLRESILPQTICSKVSCGSSICEGFTLQSLKTRLDFDIVAHFV